MISAVWPWYVWIFLALVAIALFTFVVILAQGIRASVDPAYARRRDKKRLEGRSRHAAFDSEDPPMNFPG